jgi:hypothetical protein
VPLTLSAAIKCPLAGVTGRYVSYASLLQELEQLLMEGTPPQAAATAEAQEAAAAAAFGGLVVEEVPRLLSPPRVHGPPSLLLPSAQVRVGAALRAWRGRR